MVAKPFWITPEIAIVPRPRGGDSLDKEMAALRKAGVDILVSMLEPSEATELGLDREEAAARKAGLQFVNFAVTDRSVPSSVARFETFVFELQREIEKGKRIGVHCRACIGRSSVVAASLLIRSGMPGERAWQQIEKVRGCRVPDTQEQRDWVDRNVSSPA
jgi:protein-tyrosine phosphatase